MKTIIIALAAFFALSLPAKLTVTSPSFTDGGDIPAKFTCQGKNVSPALKVVNIPEGTVCLAIIVHDPDATHPGGVYHWVAWNLPPKGDIPENFVGSIQGKNTSQHNGYMGMCPPTGRHHYNFRVYALDMMLHIDGNSDHSALEQAMQGHILAEGVLTGLYSKNN